MMTSPADDPAPLTARWVETLWPILPDGEWLSIFAADNDGDRRTLWAKTPLEVAAAVAPYLDTHNLWLAVATRTHNLGNRRGGAADCGHIAGLWFDLDIVGPHHSRTDYPPDEATALDLIDGWPLPPTFIVRTGGGLQPWWLLDEPLAVGDAADLLDAWAHTWTTRFADAGYHLDNVFDLARVMRLPGSRNMKSDPPIDVELVDRPTGGRYGPDDLDQHLEQPPPPPAARQLTRPDITYIGPPRPGDAFNAAHTGGEILEAAGWAKVRSDTDGTHYRHPTATAQTSATVYNDDGHTTIWTDSYPNLEPRRPYDPAGLYVAMHHGGDWRAATRALSAQGYGARPITTADVAALIDQLTPHQPTTADQLGADLPDVAAWLVDWAGLWDTDTDTERWLAEPVIAKGRAHALYAAAKAGKSMLVLDIVAALAAGRPILGGPPPDQPVNVLYLDYEMTPEDLLDRLDDLGYTADDAPDLEQLRYIQLPMLPALNTEHGAAYVLQAVDYWHIDLVVIDTTQRVVDGDENSMEPYRDLALHLGLPLKQRGVAYLRLDHAGKDRTLGQRGSSAKNDDVDVIWELRRDPGDDGLLTLKSTARMSWVPQQLTVERNIDRTDQGDYINYQLPASVAGLVTGITQNQIRALRLLEALELPVDISRRQAEAAIKTAGRPVPKTKDLGAALKWRQAHPPPVDNPVDKVVPSSGNHPTSRGGSPNEGTTGNHPPKTRLNSGEPPREPGGTTPPRRGGAQVPPSKGGTRAPGHPKTGTTTTDITDLIGPHQGPPTP